MSKTSLTEQQINERAHLAVITLLRHLKAANAGSVWHSRAFIGSDLIATITQSSDLQIAVALYNLLEAGLLAKIVDNGESKFGLTDDTLLKNFEKEGWDGQARILALTHDANGDFVPTGHYGAGWELERDGHIETQEDKGYDSQVSRITDKGRVAYYVCNLIIPRAVQIAETA
jgi:hypothetical protein